MSPIAAVSVWLAVAAVLLQPLSGFACECDCHVTADACCHASSAEHDASDVAIGGTHEAPEPTVPLDCANCGSAHDAPVFVSHRTATRDEQVQAATRSVRADLNGLPLGARELQQDFEYVRADVACSAAASCARFCRFTI